MLVLIIVMFVQKWNKGKLKEKLNAKVLFDEETWARFLSEVPKVNIEPLCVYG